MSIELTSFEDYAVDRLGENTHKEIESRAKITAAYILSLQSDVVEELKQHIAHHKIGFNQIQENLGTSASQTSRIVNGKANFTFETLSKIAYLLGKRPRIVFE